MNIGIPFNYKIHCPRLAECRNDYLYFENLILRILLVFEEGSFDDMNELFKKINGLAHILGREGSGQLQVLRQRFDFEKKKYEALKDWEYQFEIAIIFNDAKTAEEILHRIQPYKEFLGTKFSETQKKYQVRFKKGSEYKRTGEGSLKELFRPKQEYYDALRIEDSQPLEIKTLSELRAAHIAFMKKYHQAANLGDPEALVRVQAANNARDIIKAYFEQFGEDAAMSVNHQNTGGIDLTPADMSLQTRNSNGTIKFYMDSAMLKQLQNAPGFVPVIINIQPLKSLRDFLGLNQASQSNVV